MNIEQEYSRIQGIPWLVKTSSGLHEVQLNEHDAAIVKERSVKMSLTGADFAELIGLEWYEDLRTCEVCGEEYNEEDGLEESGAFFCCDCVAMDNIASIPYTDEAFLIHDQMTERLY